MKILVTGHRGYLGGEFVKRYGKDYEVVGFDIQDGDDILDYKKLLVKMEGCEQVVHLAAIPRGEESKTFEDFFAINVEGTYNVAKAALAKKVRRIIFSSSTSFYGIEHGIPFAIPVSEGQQIVSQYIPARKISATDAVLSYHISKVIDEQILAWYGLSKKIQTVALRFGPINKIFLGTSVSIVNATAAIKLAIDSEKEFWYEAFSIVDELEHIDISKARKMLGYKPEKPHYSKEQIRSTLEDRAKL